MNEITLSVCIATRNRASTIGRTLESIIHQATDAVEIVVVDGASTDNTEQVVGTYKQRFSRLRYYGQADNGGFDRDCSKAVGLAHGQYCWLMTDDDIFKEGALATVLNHVPSGYDLIVVNTESRTTDLSRVLARENMPILSDRLYRPDEFRDLFVNTAQHLSYVAAVVIRKDIWIDRVKEDFFGSWFVHVGVIFREPLAGNTLVLKEPLIAVRRGNVSWSSRSFEIWLFSWPHMIWSLSALDDRAKESVIRREPWKSPLVLMRFRGSRIYSYRQYTKWIKNADCSPVLKTVAKLISILPVSLLNPLLVLYLAVSERNPRPAIYEIIRSPLLRKILCAG